MRRIIQKIAESPLQKGLSYGKIATVVINHAFPIRDRCGFGRFIAECGSFYAGSGKRCAEEEKPQTADLRLT